jgi:hypothetical protein
MRRGKEINIKSQFENLQWNRTLGRPWHGGKMGSIVKDTV